MSFGDLLGSLTGNAASITNPTDATNAGIVVSVGDLIFGVIGEQTSMTSTGVTDNLGNTYTSTNNTVNDAGTSTGRAFYARVTVAGTLTAVHFAATASSDNVAVFAAVFKGPFIVSPLDTNPANITSDITSPFACPATGTLSQAKELVVAWGVATNSTVWAATSPNTLVGQATTAAILHTVIGYQTVNATTTVTPNFTAGANPTDAILGTASFKQELITRLGGKGHDVGLVLHAPLNEGAGLTAHDISGNLNHGTLTNSPTWVRDPRFGNTIKTTNAAFSYVNFGDIQDANFVSTDSFSVLLWYKGDTAQFTAHQDNGTLGVAGTTLTVTVAPTGTLLGVGMAVETTAGGSLTEITALGTGSGGTGTYTVNTTANVAAGTNWVGAANGYQQFNPMASKVLTSGNFTGWEIYLDYGSNPRGAGGLKIQDTAGVNATATTPVMPYITTGVWHLWAAVVDRTAQLCKLSFDGLPFGTASCSSVGALTNTATVQVAFQNGQAGTFHDFRIYKRALSLAEINAIYNGQRYDYRTSFRTNASRWNLGVSATNVTLTGAGATASAGSFSKTITSNVTLTGASATTSAGTLVPSISNTLTGASATSSAGSLTPSISKTLTGAGATASAGTLLPSISDTLTGASATTSAGTLLPSISDTLTGASATSTAGSLGPSISKTLAGVGGTASSGTLAPSISITLSGVVATTNAGSLSPTVSKTLTGVSATITAGSLGPSISLTLSGVSATTNAGSLAPSISKTLVGASSTASAGTLTASTGTSNITLTLAGVFATTSAGSLTPTISKTLAGVLASAAAGILAPSISKTLAGALATVSAGSLNPTVSKALVGVSASTGIGSFLITHQYFVAVNEHLNAAIDTKTNVATSLTEFGSAASSSTIIIPVFLNETGNAAVTTFTNIGVIQHEGNFFGGSPITKELIFATAVEHITLNETGNAIASATGLRTFFVTVNESGNAATTLISTTKYRLQVSEQRTAAVTNSDSLQVFRQLNEIGAAISRQDLNLFVDHEVVNAIDSALGTLGTHLTVTESGNATVIPVVVSIHTNLTESGNAVSVQNAAQRSPALFAYFVEEDALAQDVASRPVISAKLDTNSSFNPVPGNMKDWYPWLPLTARAVNNILAGKQNVTQRTITLSPNASQTAFSDSRIGVNSFLSISPISATASTDNPWFSDQTNGAVTINHASAASKDRTYRVVILG